MGRLLLVRHGESEGNVSRILTTTPLTLALTPLGRDQAREAAAVIRKIAHPCLVIASPYARAHDTGEIIAKELNLPFEIRAGLHERETGEFAGRPYEAILEAEDYDPILDEIVAHLPSEDVVVVSHGGVMVAMWAHMTGRWEDAPIPANCAIILVEHRHGKYLQPQLLGDAHSQRDTGG
jgi:broad specificity phosphatase PhoE